eukprot:TRINITY_DN19756_c0_g1_i2.p2 TRINITY_DN19756_c0_g1~~TRINITY_DN19756_c0_g1_i2.p2  ORF type:complete len:182 (-),score=7.43 TRINITY_DN19756_c0_g1_i2:267-812(-)
MSWKYFTRRILFFEVVIINTMFQMQLDFRLINQLILNQSIIPFFGITHVLYKFLRKGFWGFTKYFLLEKYCGILKQEFWKYLWNFYGGFFFFFFLSIEITLLFFKYNNDFFLEKKFILFTFNIRRKEKSRSIIQKLQKISNHQILWKVLIFENILSQRFFDHLKTNHQIIWKFLVYGNILS